MDPFGYTKPLRSFLLHLLLLCVSVAHGQLVPVIELVKPALGADSVVHTTEDHVLIGGRVLSSSEVMLRVNKDYAVVKEGGLFMYTLSLEAGKNKVRVGAANKAGKFTIFDLLVIRDEAEQPQPEKAPVVMGIPPQEPPSPAIAPELPVPVTSGVVAGTAKQEVPSAIIATSPPVPAPAGEEDAGAAAPVPVEIRALIIAVGKHKYGEAKNLKYPAKDAASFYDFLTSPDGLAADPKNVRLLVDENATREAILAAMRDMMNGANSTDVFFLYFSGHGQTVDNGEEYYFFTYDTRMEDQNAIVSSALSRTEVRGRLQNGKVRKKVLFLDACYSGMMASGGKSMGERREHLFQEMAETDDALVVFTSSSDTEQSFEDETLGGGHGIFTYYLVKGLQGEADKARDGNRNGKVTVYELDRYLAEEVNARAVATKDQPQRPKRDCTHCDDFPLSVTSDYDISTATPRNVQQVEWTIPPPKVESGPTPVTTTSSSGRTYETYKLPPAAREIYEEPADPRYLNGQIYADEATGDKITFDGHSYANVVVTGVLGGQVIDGPGKISGIQVAFADQAGDRMKEGFAVFSPDSSSLDVRLDMVDGSRQKYTLQRLGVAKREDLVDRRFMSDDGATELSVHAASYSTIYVSGHVGGTIIDAKGLIQGDVMQFVDERKDAYATGKVVLNDDWTALQGVIGFGSGPSASVNLHTTYMGPGYTLNNSIYGNATNDQTINFHNESYANIAISGIVGEENIQCAGTVKGDVVSLNDRPNDGGYLPSKLVLRDKGNTLEGVVIFKDRSVVRVNMKRKK